MKRLLIKLAYRILQHYCVEKLPYFYCDNSEYEVISAEIHPISGYFIIKAERKEK